MKQILPRKLMCRVLIIVPIISLCAVCNPLVVQRFTKLLSPFTFFDCQDLFSENPKFTPLAYKGGLEQSLMGVYPFLIICAVSSLLGALLQNYLASKLIREAVRTSSGLLDVLFAKLLRAQENVVGNVSNLAYGDIQKVCGFLPQLQNLLQIPFNIAAFIAYLASQVTPAALSGLCGYFFIFALSGVILRRQATIQRRLMSMRDSRIKRATEVLNGIRVIKLFTIEQIQEQIINKKRQLELGVLFRLNLCSSGFAILATATGPAMTSIALGTLMAIGKFNLANAFAAMFLFQYLAIAVVVLPQLMSAYQDAKISSSRLEIFFRLPEKNEDFVRKSITESSSLGDSTEVLRVVGSPSFGFNHSDLAPHGNIQLQVKEMVAQKAKLEQQKTQLIQLMTQKTNIKQLTFSDQHDVQLAQDKMISTRLIDRWANECDVPYQDLTIQSYKKEFYSFSKQDQQIIQLKKLVIHISVLQQLIQQNSQNGHAQFTQILDKVDFAATQGQIIGLMGQIGQGKTSLLKSFLGELRQFDNKSHVICNTEVAYFSQQPVIFSDSIRENILFGKKYDEQKYRKIVRICCLNQDLKTQPKGDMTIVGGKGVTLSGGQKSRIALARVLYSEAKLVLLDDPLSALDARVSKKLWNDAIIGYLKQNEVTVIISCNQTQYFEQCDRLFKVEDGRLAETTIAVQAALNDSLSLTSADNVTISSEEHFAPHLTQTLPNVSNILNKQKPESKPVKQKHQFSQWLTQGSAIVAFIAVLTLIVSQGLSQFSTLLITYWGTDKFKWSKSLAQNTVKMSGCKNDPSYWQESVCVNINNFITTISKQETFTNKLGIIQYCAQQKHADIINSSNLTSIKYIQLYLIISGLMLVINFIGNIVLVRFNLKTAMNIHDKMIKGILHAKMKFFDTTSQGQVINRMSKDIDVIDINILRYIQGIITTGLIIAGMMIIICIVSWYCIFIEIACICVFIYFYKTFKIVFPHIKRVEAITRSPVLNTCQETIDGIVTIRAYQVQTNFVSQFRRQTDLNQSVYLQGLGMIRWLQLRLNLLSAAFSFCVCLIATFMAPSSSSLAGQVGIMISYSFSVSNLLMQLVVTSVSLEGDLPAVDRVLEFANLQSEGFSTTELAPNSWPSAQSEVCFKGVNLGYSPNELVLKNIDMKIKPGEHVGIVGRTGSGKSTMMAALCRLYEPSSGKIIIDGVNILELDLQEARQALGVIPQEPFLFSGTLRGSLCPYSYALSENVHVTSYKQIDDLAIWAALDQVQLTDYIKQQGGLDCPVTSNGDNFSAGQRQLLCVARAILQNRSCIIMDEATAMIDKATELLIVQMLKNRPETIICIAHRLETIIEFDKVIVVEDGVIVEMDTPAMLIRSKGIFQQLVSQCDNAEELQQLAFQVENKTNKFVQLV